MSGKIERVPTWEKFKELLTMLSPSEIYFAQGKAPLARPPVELRLTFTAQGVQYVFVDTAEEGILRRTRLRIRKDKHGNFSLEEEDIKRFIYSQLGRDDIKIRSFELMGGY
ncbi:MAG: hypothetical protein ACLFU9_02195 [Candidatus Bathyarchaeia archaeon]